MGLNGTVAMSGGVALNEDVVAALGDELRTKVIAVENPQIVGALGAALFAYEKCH
jgi:activator of 2-hydroxyglutaryl-CoA dehydratase